MKTQLLLTFTKLHKLNETIDDIKDCYQIMNEKIYVLKNLHEANELICSYNIIIDDHSNSGRMLSNTISVHRKKDSGTIYTINALNQIIALLNDGVVDVNYVINWDNYKNMILLTNAEGIRKIYTKLYKII